MTVNLTIFEPHQIVRTTNTTGAIINSWEVMEDGSLRSVQVALFDSWSDPEQDASGEQRQ